LQGAADNQNKRPPLLLKLNDLIAIHIDGSEPDAEDYDPEEEESQGDAQKAIPEVELDVEPPSVRSSSTEEGVNESTPIFLKVVNIDYAPTSLTNGSSDHSGDRNPSPDRTATAIAFGELGCSINPGSTRVSMVGVEHGLVPCMAPYEEDDEDGDVESGVFNLKDNGPRSYQRHDSINALVTGDTAAKCCSLWYCAFCTCTRGQGLGESPEC
jgi:hypothetical protein